MENNNQNTAVKRNNRHLIISLSIIGCAFIIALIIGVIAIIGNLGNRINGKNPEKLYDSMTSTISSSGNYVINVQKSGNGTLFHGDNGESKAIDEVITTNEVSMVDGDNVYYKKTLKRVSAGEETTTTLEIVVVDGVKYFRYIVPGKPAQKYRSTVVNNDYKEATELLDALVWEYDDLFDDVKLESISGGKKAQMNKEEVKGDPEFNEALTYNAQCFFADNAGTNGAVLSGLPIKFFEDYDYSVVYDSDGRAVAVAYSYAMGNGNFFAGDLSLEATVSYGNARVSAPQDAEEYQWAKTN